MRSMHASRYGAASSDAILDGLCDHGLELEDCALCDALRTAAAQRARPAVVRCECTATDCHGNTACELEPGDVVDQPDPRPTRGLGRRLIARRVCLDCAAHHARTRRVLAGRDMRLGWHVETCSACHSRVQVYWVRLRPAGAFRCPRCENP